jgi:Divergent InlB B-repeat domain/Right handed beta helix region
MKAKLTLLLALIFFLGMFNFALIHEAQSAHWEWQNPLPTGNSLEEVWRSPDGSDVFAVGSNGTILRYNGISWITMDSGVTTDLYGVWGTSSTDVFAVGRNGVILHYDGVAWIQQSSNSGSYLYDVWGSSGIDVYAVGTSGTILHYNGSSWSTVASGLFPVTTFQGVWGSGTDDVYMVGSGETIAHWDGTGWTDESPDITGQYLYGVWGDGAGTVYAVGGSGTVLVYIVGVGWQGQTNTGGTVQTLYNVWGSDTDDVIAVGSAGTILHYDSLTWNTDISGSTETLYGISGPIANGSELYAVGTSGSILQYNGSIWVPFGASSVNSATLNDIWGSSSTDIFAVGYTGTILRSDGTTWSAETSNTTENLDAVWGSSGSDVFAVGWNGTVVHYDGSNWTASAPTGVRLKDVWGSSGSDVFVVGNTGTILHWNGSAWSTMASGTVENLNGVWGFSSTDVYAVGTFDGGLGMGTVLHYDGTSWSQVLDIPINDELYAIWGSGPDNIYATGYGGAIMHYDGSAWRQIESMGNDLETIWGSDADDVYALDGNSLFHYDGYVWSPVSTNFNSANSIWGSSADDVYLVTGQGGIVHYAVDTFYVDITRPDNTGDGTTPAAAWKTLHYAINEINAMSAGNYQLVVAGGIYSFANGEPDVALLLTQDNVSMVGLPGAILQGIPFQNTTWANGLDIVASNVTVRSLEIRDFFYEVSLGIWIAGGDNVAVQDCVIHNNNSGVGIEGTAGTGIHVTGCTIYDHNLYGITVDDNSPEIFRNMVFDNERGINVNEFSSNNITPAIYNNLIYDFGSVMQYGIYISAFSTGATISAEIYHNTIDGGGGGLDGIYITQEETPSAFDIKYNIITNFGGYGIRDASPTPINPVLDYNNVYNPTGTGNYLNVTAGINGVSADPIYIDDGNRDFRLQNGSPSVNVIGSGAGNPFGDDLDGNVRPLGFGNLKDMGCYERRWHQVNMDGFGDAQTRIPYTMAVYNNTLYSSTNDGIWSYDGVDWIQIKVPGTISSNRVTLSPVGFNGNLYAGMDNSPLQVGEYNGSSWSFIMTDSFGDSNNAYLGSLIVYNGTLYGSTYNASTGTEIWRYNGAPDNWTQVNTDGFGDPNNIYAESLVEYNGLLYAGTYNDTSGAEVWSYNGTIWSQVNPDGFGSGFNRSVNALAVYNGELYAGTSNIFSGTGAELWKYDEVEWTQITFDDTATQISSMTVFEGKLFTGSSSAEIWAYNGVSWTKEDTSRFGDTDNLYVNCMAAYKGELYAATQNQIMGIEVWGAGNFVSPSEVPQYSLTNSVSGSGDLAFNPPDVIYDENTVVTITATPDAGWLFSGWGDDLTGNTNPETITMDTSKIVTANFIELPSGQFELTVTSSGSGSVTLSPPDVLYDVDTVVTLTAVPDAGWAFAGWGGELSGNTNPTTILMDADKFVTATFVAVGPTQYTLTVSTSGSGSVTLNPTGGVYDVDTVVTLTPTPLTGWIFSGWSGDLTGAADPGSITMDADKTVIATFMEKTSPDQPTAVGTGDETNYDVSDTIVLNTSPYYDPDTDPHTQTHWQIWRADNNELIFDEIATIDLTQYTILPDTLIEGLKYIWRAGYEDSDTNVSWSIEYAFKIGTSETDESVQVTTGTDVADYKMVSFVQYPDDPRAEVVFGDELVGEYDGNYRIGTYNASRSAYDEYGTGRLMVVPGKGYWFLAREGLDTIVDGVPVSLSTEIYVALDYNPNTLDGWNMVGPPNGADYLWGDVEVVVDDGTELTGVGSVQSLPDDNPYIDRRLWRWESGSYATDTPETDSSQVMAAYEGYWVKAKQANVYLRFDPDTQMASRGQSDALLARTWHKASSLLSVLNIFSHEAIADNDTPPMPMGGLDDNTVDPVFQGCFIEIVDDFDRF